MQYQGTFDNYTAYNFLHPWLLKSIKKINHFPPFKYFLSFKANIAPMLAMSRICLGYNFFYTDINSQGEVSLGFINITNFQQH